MKKNKIDKKKPLEGATSNSSNNNSQANINRVHLSPTQSRAVKLLLTGSYISWDLERLIHCRYAPDIIQHLRLKGISIITEMVSHIRATDGKKVKVGKYSIAPESLDKARLSVNEG